MKRVLLLSLFVLLASAVTVSAQSISDGSLLYGGYERTYVVYVPASYDGTEPVPLVIALHGGGGFAENMARTTDFNVAADEHGFIVAYPNGVGNGWNDGRTAILQIAIRQRVDDVGFLTELIDELKAQYRIDRVYMTGISNGGMMTFRYACAMADQLAGFMTVVANLPDPIYNACAPSQPIPAVMVFGEADPLMPFAGGIVGAGARRGDYGTVVSAEDTISVWTAANGCADASERSALPDSVDDDAQVTLTTYADCAAPVQVYRIANGGHGWPGDTSLRLRLTNNGIVTQDISATELFIEAFGL